MFHYCDGGIFFLVLSIYYHISGHTRCIILYYLAVLLCVSLSSRLVAKVRQVVMLSIARGNASKLPYTIVSGDRVFTIDEIITFHYVILPAA